MDQDLEFFWRNLVSYKTRFFCQIAKYASSGPFSPNKVPAKICNKKVEGNLGHA